MQTFLVAVAAAMSSESSVVAFIIAHIATIFGVLGNAKHLRFIDDRGFKTASRSTRQKSVVARFSAAKATLRIRVDNRGRRSRAFQVEMSRIGVFGQISEVNNHLYLSGAGVLRPEKLRQKRITCVINVTNEEPSQFTPGAFVRSRAKGRGQFFEHCKKVS